MKLSCLFDFSPKGPKDFAGTLFSTGFPAVRPISQALFMINTDQIVLNAHRTGRARLNAYLAGDAANLAETSHRLSRIMGAAGNPDPSL